MKRPKVPCRFCEDRTSTCHAECDRYADYKAALDEWKKAVKNVVDSEHIQDDYEITKHKRLKELQRLEK